MADDKQILRIISSIDSIGLGQIAVEPSVDSDLGFRMWGGKDSTGLATRFLAKDQPMTVSRATISGASTTGSDGFLRHDTAGLVAGGLITVAQLNALLSDGPIGSGTLNEAYELDGDVTVDVQDVNWTLDGYDFNIINGTDTVIFEDAGTDSINLTAILKTLSLASSADMTLVSEADLYLNDQWLSSAVTLSETGETGLDTVSDSLVGGINELKAGIDIFDKIQFNTSYSAASEPEGQIWWNSNDYTLNVSTGMGPVLQVGQESYVIIHNGSGVELANGTPVYPIGASAGRPSVDKANASTHVGITGVVLMTTMTIAIGGIGIATMDGKINGADTSLFSPGDTLWVGVTDGALTNTKPEFPNYVIQVGGVLVSDAVNGVIITDVKGSPEDTVNNFWNGTIRESFDFEVTSNGTVITGALSPQNGHPDLTLMFSAGFSIFTATPDATIALTAGTDINPQTNYVYILKSTKALTVSISDWPTAQHIKVAQVCLQSAATTQTSKALRNQNWNDHIESTTSYQGHLSHITEAVRNKIGCSWWSGAEGTLSIDTGPTPDAVTVATTSGQTYQLHKQTFTAMDTAVSDDVHIVNHSTTPYLSVQNLNGQELDANGDSLDNKSFSFVLWGVQNSGTEQSHLMLNLPTGSYSFTAPQNAEDDALNYAVYDIPKKFRGVGFLIAKFNLTFKTNSWVLYSTEDLREEGGRGGGGGGAGVTSFTALDDTPSAYTDQAGKLVKVNSGESALEFLDTFAIVEDQTELDAAIVAGKTTIFVAQPITISSTTSPAAPSADLISVFGHSVYVNPDATWSPSVAAFRWYAGTLTVAGPPPD